MLMLMITESLRLLGLAHVLVLVPALFRERARFWGSLRFLTGTYG